MACISDQVKDDPVLVPQQWHRGVGNLTATKQGWAGGMEEIKWGMTNKGRSGTVQAAGPALGKWEG